MKSSILCCRNREGLINRLEKVVTITTLSCLLLMIGTIEIGVVMRRINPPVGKPPLCTCGCGQPVKWADRREKGFPRWNKYIRGHFEGRCWTKEQKKRHSENKKQWLKSHSHNRTGSQQTKEVRRAIGDGIKKFWETHAHPRLGTHRPKEVGVKISKSKIARSLRGEHNSNWAGGLTLYGPGFTCALKEQVKKRDKYACRLCGDSSSRQLCIHHINYDKNDHRIENLISLCDQCHPRTNAKRRWWQKKLEKIV